MKPSKLNPALAVLATFLGHLRGAAEALGEAFGTVPSPLILFKWNSTIPRLARAVADMIDLEPGQFSWLSFTAERLRALEAELQHLTETRAFLEGFVGQLDEMIYARKGELARMTSEATTGLKNVLASPTTTEQTRQKLVYLSQAVQGLLEEHYGALRERRQKNALLIEKAKDGSAPADPAALSAPRRARRPRRTRR